MHETVAVEILDHFQIIQRILFIRRAGGDMAEQDLKITTLVNRLRAEYKKAPKSGAAVEK